MKKEKGKNVYFLGWIVADVRGYALVTPGGGFAFDKRKDAVAAMEEVNSPGDRIARVEVREVSPKRKARP